MLAEVAGDSVLQRCWACACCCRLPWQPAAVVCVVSVVSRGSPGGRPGFLPAAPPASPGASSADGARGWLSCRAGRQVHVRSGLQQAVPAAVRRGGQPSQLLAVDCRLRRRMSAACAAVPRLQLGAHLGAGGHAPRCDPCADPWLCTPLLASAEAFAHCRRWSGGLEQVWAGAPPASRAQHGQQAHGPSPGPRRGAPTWPRWSRWVS